MYITSNQDTDTEDYKRSTRRMQEKAWRESANKMRGGTSKCMDETMGL